MANLHLRDWLGQSTTGNGMMILVPTLLSLAGGTISWNLAIPLLMAGLSGLVWPENTALKSALQKMALDVEAVVTAYRAGLEHGAVTTPASPEPPSPTPLAGGMAVLAGTAIALTA